MFNRLSDLFWGSNSDSQTDNPNDPKSTQTPSKDPHSFPSYPDLDSPSKDTPPHIEPPSSPSPSPSPSQSPGPSPQQANQPQIEGIPLFKTTCDFYLYDQTTKQFHLKQPEIEVIISQVNEPDTFQFFFYLVKNGRVLLSQSVSNAIYPKFKGLVFFWVISQGRSQVHTCSLVFDDFHHFRDFKHSLVISLWETNAKLPFKSVNKNSIDWVLGAFDEQQPKQQQDDDLTDGDLLRFENMSLNDDDDERSDEEDEDEEEEEEDDSNYRPTQSNSKSRNKSLTVGLKNRDISFVVRGPKIGVFKQTDDDDLKLTSTINDLKNSKGQVFSPSKMMLHQQDSSMLLLNPTEKNSIYCVDLNRGNIVEEWKTAEDFPLKELFPQSKYSQLEPEPIVCGLHGQGAFLIDPRLPKLKQVSDHKLLYSASTNPQLSCAVTTNDGHIAVGSRKGEIRLFKKDSLHSSSDPLARPTAKTNLPGFGDPIIAIDATDDGEWILATCETYLLLVPTGFDNTNGFLKPMGQKKPIPKRLQLHQDDLAKVGGTVKFTPAHFNIGMDNQRSICTSTGRYLITWNFRKVKQDKLYEYQIKKYPDTVVADQFKYGEDRSIIVAMPDDVRLAKRIAP